MLSDEKGGRKTDRESKKKKKKKPKVADEIPNLCTEDTLDLQSLIEPEVPEGTMFPEELNRYLRTQLQILTSRNGCLLRSLEEREGELRVMSQKLLQEQRRLHLSPLPGLGRASEMAASKIVGLSKRVRELGAELEVHRQKARTAEARVALLEERVEETPQTKVTVVAEHSEDEFKVLTDKLSATNARLCETRNQNQQLRQDLKLAHKALANEVGEAACAQALSGGQSSWRGRAQQILLLQQKLTEMREQAGERPQCVPAGEKAVRELERGRRHIQEQTSRELKEVTSRLDETQRRLDGARARTKVLDAELAAARSRLGALLEKGTHDQELIAMLSGQLAAAETRYKDRDTSAKCDLERLEKERRSLEQEINHERARAKQLQNTIDLMKKEAPPPPPIVVMDSPPSHRPDSASSQQNAQQLSVLSLAAEAERVRLLELLAVVNRRLDTQQRQAAEAEEALRQERQRAARLETKLARAELERVGAKVCSYRSSHKLADKDKELMTDDVKYKLELLQEEVLALQSRLQCVQQEKHDDLRTYTSLLEQARTTFLQALRNSTDKKIKSTSPQ